MSNLKKYIIYFLITLLSIFITHLVTTTLYYFNIITPTTYNILKLITLLLSLFINGFILGKKSKNKGYLEGLKLSFPVIILFIIITLFTTNSFHIKLILYYLILIITTTFGSMIGINTKKDL